MEKVINALIRNSKASQLACIEIHNKPIFPFRYEVCIILNINSWELLFKAFILKHHPEVRVINEDGTTKGFEECLNFLNSQLGKDFTIFKESIQKLYEYRCNVIHYYTDNIDVLLYSLLSKNVFLYADFLNKYFNIDIAHEINLVLLPIGFYPPLSPIDFLSNGSQINNSSIAVQKFIKSIIKSTETIRDNGLEDSILYGFKMILMNEKRIKNADVIAAITKNKNEAAIFIENIIGNTISTCANTDEAAKKVKIEEESLFQTYYTETFRQVAQNCRKLFSDFVKIRSLTN